MISTKPQSTSAGRNASCAAFVAAAVGAPVGPAAGLAAAFRRAGRGVGRAAPGWCRTGDRRHDRGQVTAFVAVTTFALLLVIGLVVDGGRALLAKTQALDAAQGAARAGAQHLDLVSYRASGMVRLDPPAARQGATDWLSAAGEHGTVVATPAQVTVTVHRRYQTTLLRLAGVRTIDLTVTATARPVHGIAAAGSP